MRRYETIVIIDPDLSDENRGTLFNRISELITQHDGFLILNDQWGSKKLAYEIKKKVRGYYIRLDFCGTSELVNELERFFRIDDRIMKYMTVVLDKNANVDRIREEMAEAERQAENEAEAAAVAEEKGKAAETTTAQDSVEPAAETTAAQDSAESAAETTADQDSAESAAEASATQTPETENEAKE